MLVVLQQRFSWSYSRAAKSCWYVDEDDSIFRNNKCSLFFLTLLSRILWFAISKLSQILFLFSKNLTAGLIYDFLSLRIQCKRCNTITLFHVMLLLYFLKFIQGFSTFIFLHILLKPHHYHQNHQFYNFQKLKMNLPWLPQSISNTQNQLFQKMKNHRST